MPLVNSKQILLDAQQYNYAVGAFNVENMEMVKAVIGAAEELKAPVILQTTPSTVKYAGTEVYHAMVNAFAARSKVPVCLHLDHGDSYDLAVQAIRAGYTSIMIDGSAKAYDDNVAISRKVVNEAKRAGVPVEAELGRVGGKEDDLDVEADTNTDVGEAIDFVQRTEIDSLAVAIGTAHGFYAGTPVLNKQRLSEIRDNVSIPLVLHGASGISDEDVRDCIRRGICKVNFATELRVAYTDAVKELLREKPETFDPKVLGKVGIEAVKQLVKNRMMVCGCDGKAETRE